jgi:putative DNA primase/helicase
MNDQPDLSRADCIGSLSHLEFDRRKEDLAKELGVSVKALNAEYRERRKIAKEEDEERKKREKNDGETSVMQAHWDVEPWPEPVNGDELVRDIARRIRRHVVMNANAVRTVALWVIFAWVHDAAVHSPILLASSPEAECGKTTLLGLISFMVRRGIAIVEGSPAVIYRMIEKWRPTLIVDEADSVFKNNPELRGIINSGWTRGTGVPRCHPDTHEPEFFETFGPKAIGLKGLNVPDTTLSRSIIIEMERKLPEDRAEGFAHIDDDELAKLRRRLARFSQDNIESLRSPSPHMPEGFGNRLEANWKMLLAIAELCGVGEAARASAVALSRRSDEASLGVELLRDIRGIFEQQDVDRIRSEELTNKLGNMADRPWAEMPWTGKPITQPQLARLLKPYKVKPKKIRFDAGPFNGYELAWFEKAWRYIPASTPQEPGTPEQSQSSAKNAGTFAGTGRNNVPGNVPGKMAEDRQCSSVPGNQGGRRGNIEPPPRGGDNDQFDCLKDPSRKLKPKADEFPELPHYLRRNPSMRAWSREK